MLAITGVSLPEEVQRPAKHGDDENIEKHPCCSREMDLREGNHHHARDHQTNRQLKRNAGQWVRAAEFVLRCDILDKLGVLRIERRQS